MNRIITSRPGVVVLLSLLALVGTVGMSDATLAQQPNAEASQAERAGPDVAPAKRAYGDLSIAFRNLARQTLPAVVSIEAIRHPTKHCKDPSGNHTFGCGFVVSPDEM